MAFNLMLPQLNKEVSVKDCIISILSYNWPLTQKKLYNLIKKKYGKNITYQAVYKAIRDLLNIHVILKVKEGYQINTDWLNALHRYTEVVQSNYFIKNKVIALEGVKESKIEGNINVLTFATLFDAEKYLYYLQKEYISKSRGKEIICTHHSYEWRPLFYLRAEYNWIINMNKLNNKSYILCANKTVVDKWCAKFYKSLGFNIKLGVNCASTCEIIVLGDLVIQIYLPKHIKDKFNKKLNSIKTLDKINVSSLIKDIFEKECDIQIVINKDSKIAEQIKENTLSHFK